MNRSVAFVAKYLPVLPIERIVFSVAVSVMNYQSFVGYTAPVTDAGKKFCRLSSINSIRATVFKLWVSVIDFVVGFCSNRYMQSTKPSTNYMMTNPEQKSYFSTSIPSVVKIPNFLHRKFYKTISFFKSGLGNIASFNSFIPRYSLGHGHYYNMEGMACL
jgi:hypothetical protein